jgi:FKBP-type peptidyl-prolyl cis-trans isomerase FkpA/FKBP-type peptidyl-prolyl cis-trans isomerase FklB
MKKISLLAMAVLFMAGLASCDQKGGINSDVNLTAGIDSASYAIGINYGAGLKQNLQTLPGGPANIDALIEGFVSGMKGDSSAFKMTPEDANTFLNQFLMEAQMKDAEAEKAKGDAFLAENKTKEGVITTESGLQYKVITEGNGPRPTDENVVKVHYTGKFLDGTVFDSSAQRGEPAEFPVTGVIRGWTEGLKIMPAGSKYMFWIPSDLAYGPQGTQGIKPNSTLEFEVELLEIVKE